MVKYKQYHYGQLFFYEHLYGRQLVFHCAPSDIKLMVLWSSG